MNFDDLKDQLLSLYHRLMERVQDSAMYNQLKDRFDALTPQAQKTTVLGGAVVIYLMLLLIPYSWYSETSDAVTAFEERRNVIRELLKVSREIAEIPDIPVPPPTESLKVDAQARAREANLIDEQVKSVEVTPDGSALISNDKSAGSVTVQLSKLNLRQLVDVGSKLSRLNPSVKLTALEVQATKENPHYFDVSYKMVALAVPEVNFAPPAGEPEPAPKGRRASKDAGGEE